MNDPQNGPAGPSPGEKQVLVVPPPGAISQARQDFPGSDGYGSPAISEGESLAVTLRQYLYMVVKRKWLILNIALAFTALGGIRTLLQTPLYKATVRIQIEREAGQGRGGRHHLAQ